VTGLPAIIVSVTDESKNPIERLADLFVFAPIGFALEAREVWPRLAERGRAQVHQTGRAVSRGREWAGARMDDAQGQAEAALSGLGLRTRDNGAAPDAGAVSHLRAATAGRAPTPSSPRPPVEVSEPPVDPARLAIPDYDALSASQVVPRLAGLAPDELELVRQYEAGTRGRKTILNKIAQLQAA
jgi:hypothetical protein